MSASSSFVGPALEMPRDRYGRPLVTPPGGSDRVAYTRASTIAGALDDLYGLMDWKLRLALVGAGNLTRTGELDWSTIPDADRRAKSALNTEVGNALRAGGVDIKANRGTHIHALAEQRDKGTPVDEGEWKPLLDAYASTTAAFDRIDDIERSVVIDSLQIHGTPDCVVTLNGKKYIADIKTGSLDYPMKMALQLAIYAYAESFYDHTTGDRAPFPDVERDRGIIIHLNPDTGVCALKWIDLTWGWEHVHLALRVRQARTEGRNVLRHLYPDALADAIRAADTPAALVALWESHEPAWTDHHTALAAARKASLTASAA